MDSHKSGGRWGTVAALVMRRPGLSVAAKAVYAALATYADRHGWIWTRQETIATDLERSRAWVNAAISELEGQGLLRHDRQFIEGRQRASRYRLLDGLPRGVPASSGRQAYQDAQVSEEGDSAVEPTDTTQHEGFEESLSAASAREPMDHPNQVNEVPSDWVPSSDDVAWARAKHPGLDVLRFTEGFILSCQAKGYRYANVGAAWRRWLADPKGRLPLLPIPSAATTSSKDHSHDRSNQQRRPTSYAEQQADLLASNAAAESRVLERIMARRSGGHNAEYPA
jgi:hypothetical protein